MKGVGETLDRAIRAATRIGYIATVRRLDASGGFIQTPASVGRRVVRATTICALAAGALVICSACIPDLGGWAVSETGSDGAVPRRDGSITPPPSCAPEVTCAECPMPWLLASVEDLDGRCGGQIWRWALTGQDDSWCACEPIGAGQLPSQPVAVGFVPPDTVVAGSEGTVLAIRASDDAALWSEPSDRWPIDIFPIENPAGDQLVGVATANNPGSDVSTVLFYDAARGGTPTSRRANGDLPIGLGVPSMSMSPFNRTWFRALKSSDWAAADVDPWANVRFSSPLHTVGRSGFFLHTIHASYDGAAHRTVFTGERTDLAERPSRVYQITRIEDPGDNRVPLGSSCTSFPDGGDYDVVCDYVHAVADPQEASSTFAICGHGSERRIVRLSSFGGCHTIVEQSEVYSGARISRLSLAQTSFWP